MNWFFSIVFLLLLIFSIYKLINNKESKLYKTLIVISSLLFLIVVPFIWIVFLVLLVFSIYKLRENKGSKLYIVLIVISLLLLLISLPAAFSSDNNIKDKKSSTAHKEKKSPSIKNLTKSDVDKMSYEEQEKYMFQDFDEKEGSKLYKKNKDVYKYLYQKFFNTNYDMVEIPNENTIDEIKDSDQLSPEQSTKLEIENPKLYDKYLDTVDTSLDKEDEKKQGNNDTVSTQSDKSKLKESIKSKLTSSHGSVQSIDYYGDSLGENAVIVIKGKENLSDKMTSEGMRYAVADVVKGVKNSNVDLDDFTVDIVYPVATGDNNKTQNEHVIKSKWSMDTVKKLSKDELELLNTELEDYAISYSESSVIK
ncbi:hypothetical protein [Staphylococcus warneri]|uniref:hypothetical protein n=1 Tax=Staphylococcus warneri TaxID=1292 RepID=UPI0029296E59|nr:hypothetical protein [Staphylococcus warneri]MDU9352053.1 hypothetical protein [Staphylococcus warneri]